MPALDSGCQKINDDFINREPLQAKLPVDIQRAIKHKAPYREALIAPQHIKTLKQLVEVVRKQAETRIELKTWKLDQDGIREEVATESIPKYFFVEFDTETTGVRKGISQQTFLEKFPEVDASLFEKYLISEEEEFSDLSRYLRLLQLNFREPKIIEEKILDENGIECIKQRAGVDEKGDYTTYLIYNSDLQQEFQTNNLDWQSHLEPLKNMFESPEVVIAFMNGSFEHNQLIQYGITITNAVDIMLLQREQRSDQITENPTRADIDNRPEDWKMICEPGSASLAAISRENHNLEISKEEQTGGWEELDYPGEKVTYGGGDPIFTGELGIPLIEADYKLKQEVEEIAVASGLRETEASDFQRFDPKLEKLVSDLAELYKSRESNLKSSKAYDPVMKLATNEFILGRQIKEIILPTLYESEVRRGFSNIHHAPHDFGISIEADFGSAYYNPVSGRQLDFHALATYGSSLFDYIPLKVSKSQLRERTVDNVSLFSSILEECEFREYQGTRLELHFNSKQVPFYQNPHLKNVEKELTLDPASINEDTISHYLEAIVGLRTERMRILRESDFLGTKLGLLNRKISLVRDFLGEQLERSAIARNYLEEGSEQLFQMATPEGSASVRPVIHSGIGTVELVEFCSNHPDLKVEDFIAELISIEQLKSVLDAFGFPVKERDTAIQKILPICKHTDQAHASFYPSFGKVYK